jgi:glucose/arabinose dehydrogenase
MASFDPASFTRSRIAFLGILLCSNAGSAFALDTKLIESGLDSPIFLTAPDGDSRLFVAERGGIIKVRTGGVWSEFLNISGDVDKSGERGLLGLAFDPNFKTNGLFYVDYIDKTTLDTKIVRFNANALSLGGTVLLTVPQPPDPHISGVIVDNHKAGWIGFRPGDPNNLYIATGDGGNANDSRPIAGFDNNAQNTNQLLGKILRIDVHPTAPGVLYSTAGNPFASGGGKPEVFDYGLRNPFRNSFDRANGNLIIADVGQGAREELDFESMSSPGGNNYGWRLREGKIETPTSGIGGPLPQGAIDPVYDYQHGSGTFEGIAVIGGYVYRGSLLKDTNGTYFFGDLSGKVWSMETDADGKLLIGTLRDRTAELHLSKFSLDSFGEDGFGNLYIIDGSGEVFQIVPEPRTYAFMLAALAMLAWIVRRRRTIAVGITCGARLT